jgi:nucleotide-binding universal stress UspA family protein
MNYKTILVHVEPTQGSLARLQAVAAFAKEIGAEIIGLGGRRPLSEAEPLAAAFGGGLAVQASEAIEAAELAEAEAAFRRLAPGGEWRRSAEAPLSSLCEMAASADLIVTGLERTSPDFAPSTAEAVLRAGVPVLALPEQHPRISTDRILVAWKNTREARRAVTDALPLLRRAAHVSIVSVSTPQEAPARAKSIDDILQRLARHGLSASRHALPTRRDPAEEILDFAVADKVGLIVAGAFGHTRAGEWLLGGMTQSLLEQSMLPIFFSH